MLSTFTIWPGVALILLTHNIKTGPSQLHPTIYRENDGQPDSSPSTRVGTCFRLEACVSFLLFTIQSKFLLKYLKSVLLTIIVGASDIVFRQKN